MTDHPESGPSKSDDSRSFTVTQYNTAVQRYLQNKVPNIWVHGVITQINTRDRVTYLTLGHFEEGSPKPLSTLQVFLWTNELHAFNLKFAQLPTPFELRAELKVSMLLEAGFYVPFGKFQPKVLNIDESFTLGELAQTRKKIIESLLKDGLLDKNKKNLLSKVPLKVGLITAPGSAAYQDFTTVLMESGFSFEIFFYPAKMQGEATESTVIQGIHYLEKLSIDVLCVIRGGGSKTDLIYFDSEPISRAIANCPLPVLTGIGHEIDQSIADLVAYKNCITPTDCAKFLESRARISWDGLEAIFESLNIFWRDGLEAQWQALGEIAQGLKNRWERREAGESEKIKRLVLQMTNMIQNQIKQEGLEHRRLTVGLQRGPIKLLAGPRERLYFSQRQLKSNWKQQLQRAQESLKAKERLIQALHPMRLLEKGYSVVRDGQGKILKHIGEIKVNDVIDIQMKGGGVKSQVLAKEVKSE